MNSPHLKLLIALLGIAALPALSADRPNFVLIVADDLGYGDIGPYGNKINHTPNLDRLAREGLRFTDFHSNGPMCSPTRAALMTGRYQHRYGREFESALSGQTQTEMGLPLDAVTIAEALRGAGYATAMYGKWHLGFQPPYMPANQGFDDFRGLTSGDGDHHSHIDRSGNKDWWHNNEIEMDSGYAADLLTDYSVEFIKKNKDRSFFLYLPHLAIHFPWQGPDDGGYRVEGADYWDLSKLGQLDSKDVASKTKQMIEAVDLSVGRIVEALQEQGLAENTLVVFTSDNGGYLTYEGGFHNISSNGPLRGQKGDVYEGGHRVPAIAKWPGRVKPGVTAETAMSFDLYPTFAELAGVADVVESLDGISLAPLLFERQPLQPRTLFWRMRDEKAARKGPWKLLVLGENAPQLFNLESDIAEKNDVGGKSPEVRRDLLQELAAWEADVDAK